MGKARSNIQTMPLMYKKKQSGRSRFNKNFIIFPDPAVGSVNNPIVSPT